MGEFLINVLIVLGVIAAGMAVLIVLTSASALFRPWLDRRLGKRAAAYVSCGLYFLVMSAVVAAILTWGD